MSDASDDVLPDEWRWSCDLILTATDGSPASIHAVGWAARIAEDVPAELLTVYAFDADAEGAVADDEALRAAQERVERWCAANGALGYGMRCSAVPGDPRTVLRDAIGKEQPDLVVVGTRGGGGFPGLTVGSVTEWLAQLATFPLAVVPAIARTRTGGPILAGVDGSERSDRALHWAIGLAGRLRRPVHALHGMRWDETAVARLRRAAVERQVDAAREHARALHVDLQLTESVAHPVTALVERARDDDAEAIVVGARGHGDFGELTIGRVPRQLLHVAPRPVIVIGA
jgi:nucleotide-binding universal stress UspA family protein